MAAIVLDPVKVATLVNLNLSATPPITIGSTIDGIQIAEGDRILLKAQTTLAENGIYVVGSGGTLSRAADFAASATQATLASAQVFVQRGFTLADTGWVVSNDGNFTVGTDPITFLRFSVNAKILTDVSSYLVLRSEKGYPLTNDELDNNFKFLANEITLKVSTTDYEPADVRDKINSLSAIQANLNAWKLQGIEPSESAIVVPAASTVAVRTAAGNLSATTFIGNLNGNASSATNAAYATVAGNVNGVVAVANGGTGASNASSARTNLGAVSKSGDTMTGKLTFLAATGGSPGIASFNIPSGIAPNSPSEGDVWADNSKIYYRLNARTETFAPLFSPVFDGAPTAPTPSTLSNSTALATTAFVQSIRGILQDSINTKAPLDSPILTGTPTAPTATNTENSTRIANTAFVQDIRTLLQGNIDTKAPTNSPSLSGTPAAPTPGNDETGTRIATAGFVQSIRGILQSDINSRALSSNVYTQAQIDTRFGLHSTTSQMNSAISNALSLNTYSKTESDTRYYQKSSVYNATESDARYYQKSEVTSLLGDYYSKTQSDGRYYQKYEVYTKTESNSLLQTYVSNSLVSYATVSYIESYQDKWGSSRKFVQSSDPGGTASNGDFWFKI